MKLLRSERGMIIALVAIGATAAVIAEVIGMTEYVAIVTMCIQAVLSYKAMPAQPKP